MTRNVIWQDHEPTVQPVDETFHRQRALEHDDLRRYAIGSASTSPCSTTTGPAPRC